MAHMEKIYVKDVMITNPHTVGIDEPLSRAWDIMCMRKVRHLPVIGHDFTLKGIISQRDLYRTIAPRKSVEEKGFFYPNEALDQFVLKLVMTSEVQTLSPEHTLGCVIDLMVKKKFGCIPIVDDQGYLKGILTQIDVLRAISGHYL